MGVFQSFTLSLLCPGNEHCLQLAIRHLSNMRETASFTLGVASVIAWVVAEIPQIITNYRSKSTDGLSLTFLITWIVGDVFNLAGCMLEPATLPTQLYTAVLYTFITLSLGSQTIYYSHIYPQLKYKRQLKVETQTTFGKSNNGVENASDVEQGNEFNKRTGLSAPIPVPERPRRDSIPRELFYHSARSLSKCHAPTAGSLLAVRSQPCSPQRGSLEEKLIASSAPAFKIKNTLCLVSTLTFLGAINLLQSQDRRITPVVSDPREQFVIYVRRKLFQGNGDQLAENGAAGSSGIGTFLGWAMTFTYLGGRLPQICLNIRRGHVEGLNPWMFIFAVIGNGTYVASILVSSLDWSRIKPNLPWLVDTGGCVLLDTLILMQFVYFRRRWTYEEGM